MKYISAILIALCPLTQLRAATSPSLLVSITGELETTVGIAAGNDYSHAKIEVQKINNRSLFEDFSVTTSDYALVFSTADSAVEFVPLSASSGKPTLVAFSFSSAGIAVQASARFIVEDGTISTTSDADGTLLEGSTGEALFHLKTNNSYNNTANLVITRCTGTVEATGTTPDAPGGTAPLILHLATGKVFTQGT